MRYISLKNILDKVLRDSLFEGLRLEAAIDYCIRFFGIVDVPELYVDKQATINVTDYRAELPVDLVAINQILVNNVPAREATDTFHNFYRDMETRGNFDSTTEVRRSADYTVRVQGDYLYISMETCTVKISYKAIPIDEDGMPLIPDNPTLHRALQAYVELEYLKILWRNNKVTDKVYEDAKQLYAFAVGAYETDARKIDLAKAEVLTNLGTLWLRRSEFMNRFRNLGTVENLKTR